MKTNEISKKIGKGIALVLKIVLEIEANSTSCMVFFQPKAPKNLEKFRKIR